MAGPGWRVLGCADQSSELAGRALRSGSGHDLAREVAGHHRGDGADASTGRTSQPWRRLPRLNSARLTAYPGWSEARIHGGPRSPSMIMVNVNHFKAKSTGKPALTPCLLRSGRPCEHRWAADATARTAVAPRTSAAATRISSPATAERLRLIGRRRTTAIGYGTSSTSKAQRSGGTSRWTVRQPTHHRCERTAGAGPGLVYCGGDGLVDED